MTEKTSPNNFRSKVVAVPSFSRSASLGTGRVAGGTFNSDLEVYTHLSAENMKGGASWMSEYITKEMFEQFDGKITDKLADIRIDTNKINDLDEKVFELKRDVSTLVTSTSNMESKFDTSTSTLKSSIESIDQNVSSVLDAKFESIEGKMASKIANIQVTTVLAALGIIVTIILK